MCIICFTVQGTSVGLYTVSVFSDVIIHGNRSRKSMWLHEATPCNKQADNMLCL